MKYFVVLCLILIHTFLSCNPKKHEKSATGSNMMPNLINNPDTTFDTQPAVILKDFKSWWTYHYNNINLSEDFIGLDTNMNVLEKNTFLTLLVTGKYIVLKAMVKKNVTYYKLFRQSKEDPDIRNTITQESNKILVNSQMEGKSIPQFKFEDLNGNVYNSADTKGKIIVLKCWFIHCTACVAEFPELNKIVQQYKDRKDILFISLAMDSKEDLTAFLKDKKFDYSVVPNQRGYMINDLKATQFPTHIIIDRDGKISTIIWKWEHLFQKLQKEIAKS